jgi:hypothetical protein
MQIDLEKINAVLGFNTKNIEIEIRNIDGR